MYKNELTFLTTNITDEREVAFWFCLEIFHSRGLNCHFVSYFTLTKKKTVSVTENWTTQNQKPQSFPPSVHICIDNFEDIPIGRGERSYVLDTFLFRFNCVVVFLE